MKLGNIPNHFPSAVAVVLAVALVGLARVPLISAAETADAGEKSGGPDKSDQSDAPRPWPPRPPAGGERVGERRGMVRRQMAQPPDGRQPVTSQRVLAAMAAAPRHVFVPPARAHLAYADSPLPIGEGQTISQPYIVAIMTELLRLTPQSRVLEIGTGSAYQAAVLAHLTPHVYSMEIIEPLARKARATLDAQGYRTVRTRHADGYFGWPEAGPFDAIIVTCAAGHLPPPLWEQLKPGGRIVIPIGSRFGVQRLVQITRTEEGKRRSRAVMGVRFVPMTGRAQE